MKICVRRGERERERQWRGRKIDIKGKIDKVRER